MNPCALEMVVPQSSVFIDYRTTTKTFIIQAALLTHKRLNEVSARTWFTCTQVSWLKLKNAVKRIKETARSLNKCKTTTLTTSRKKKTLKRHSVSLMDVLEKTAVKARAMQWTTKTSQTTSLKTCRNSTFKKMVAHFSYPKGRAPSSVN